MSKPLNNTGFIRLIRAFGFSIQGFKSALKYEAAFRQELAGALVAIPLAISLGETGVEKALLISSVLLVMIVELLNSGIEAVVDRIGPEQHELSGRAKDIGSAAVLLALLLAACVWGLVLFS